MIVVTGATGKLGRLVTEALLRKVPAAELAVAVRTPEKAAGLAARGVEVRHGDYSKPDTLPSALAGADKVLLISSNEVGQRAQQHMRVIDAAKSAGVRSLAYTSVLRADTSSLALAREHKLTEEAIRASGVPFVFLRNGWYFENHTEQLRPAIEHGAILGAAGDGRFASATREDYAAAAAAALTEKEQGNRIYELAGDEPFTLSELAAEVSRQAGKPVVYKNLAPAQYAQVLASAGLPPVMVDLIVDSDLGASRGDLDGSSADMRRLIGRPTTRLADAVVAALGTRK